METTNHNAKNPHLEAILRESDQLIQEAEAFLVSQGKIFKLSEWVTIKEYAKRHNLDSTNVVSNWIKRGIIPSKDIRDFPDLNDLRLIRDKEYK